MLSTRPHGLCPTKVSVSQLPGRLSLGTQGSDPPLQGPLCPAPSAWGVSPSTYLASAWVSEPACCSWQTTRFLLSPLQAMSPDGEAIVTGAGDETLRFWNVFSKTRSTKVRRVVVPSHGHTPWVLRAP